MNKVALVGLGQLGSRHLQGLAKIALPVDIELIEPSPVMRSMAMDRYAEVPLNENVRSLVFKDSIGDLSRHLDLVIIATNADIRASVIRELLAHVTPSNLLLEKVLFQKYDDYDYFKERFLSLGINVWVNHPRRLFSFYDQFMVDLTATAYLNYQVQGVGWGLACNALHFLDHIQSFNKLTDDSQIEISLSLAEEGVVDSKRKGCLEVFGTLAGKIGNCNFSLACPSDGRPRSTISIMNEHSHLFVDEQKGFATHINLDDADSSWKSQNTEIIRYQSDLTGTVAMSILQDGHCGLPSYIDACSLHKPFIAELKSKIEISTGRSLEVCPIS